MASTNLYKKYAKADQKNVDGGYKQQVFFAPVDTITLMTLPTANAALGDPVKVTADITFPTDEGWIGLLGKLHSVTSKYTSVGDPGSKLFEHTFEIVLQGNSPELYDMLHRLLNDTSVFLLKDANCIAATAYEMFGDTCLTPEISVEFDAKTTADGTKEHKISGKIRNHKYWYSGAVTEKP